MKRGSWKNARRTPKGLRYSAVMAVVCLEHGLPMPEQEYRFAPPRRWRFDFAWLEQRVALEIQGGLFVQGRHTRGAALMKEFEKINTASSMGWRVLFATPRQLQDGWAIQFVKETLEAGKISERASA